MMDAPDEELQQPLVAPSAQATSGPTVTAPPPVPTAAFVAREMQPGLNGLDAQRPGGVLPTLGTHYIAVNAEEEEKQDGPGPNKRELPYAAPNVHPYAVPQYEPSAYGGGGAQRPGWGHESLLDQSRIPMIDIVFSGMYTLAAALTIVQGFGMMMHMSLAAVILGVYTMAFGCAAIMFDLKSVVYGVSIEQNFPFLGNYVGRALTIAFFAALCAQTYEYGGWTKFIVLYNLAVATLQVLVFFTTKTVTPAESPVLDEDLPDL